jgi:hypothetical protein
VDGVEVTELITLSPGAAGLIRQFTVSRVTGAMWFVDGGRRIDISRGDNVRFTVEVGR